MLRLLKFRLEVLRVLRVLRVSKAEMLFWLLNFQERFCGSEVVEGVEGS